MTRSNPPAPRVASALGRTADVRSATAAPPPAATPPIDLLLSYAFHAGLDHRSIHQRLPAGSLIWIDSGAFTAYTTGKKITREEYADHLRAQRGGYDYAFSLDVIGDARASRENTEWLWGQGLPVVPVFHFGSSLEEWRSLCRDYGYVAAGGLVPLAKDRTRITAYLRHLTREADKYDTAVHALGIAGRKTVINTRVWSADSSTVSSAPLYGNVPVYDHRRKRMVMLQAKDREGLWRYRQDLLRYGFPLDVIMREGKWTKQERPAMFRTSLLGVAQMWADVRQAHPLPAPKRLWAPEGRATPPGGPRASYAVFSGATEAIGSTLDYLEGPRGAHAAGPADSTDRLDAVLSGPRTASAITKKEGLP